MTDEEKLKTIEEYTRQNPYSYNVDVLVEELLSEARIEKGSESYFDRTFGNWVPGDDRKYDGPSEEEIFERTCKEAVNDFLFENNLVHEYENLSISDIADSITMENGECLKDEIENAIEYEMDRVWER